MAGVDINIFVHLFCRLIGCFEYKHAMALAGKKL